MVNSDKQERSRIVQIVGEAAVAGAGITIIEVLRVSAQSGQ